MEGPKLKRKMMAETGTKPNKFQREEGAAHTRDTQDKVSAGAESLR